MLTPSFFQGLTIPSDFLGLKNIDIYHDKNIKKRDLCLLITKNSEEAKNIQAFLQMLESKLSSSEEPLKLVKIGMQTYGSEPSPQIVKNVLSRTTKCTLNKPKLCIRGTKTVNPQLILFASRHNLESWEFLKEKRLERTLPSCKSCEVNSADQKKPN